MAIDLPSPSGIKGIIGGQTTVGPSSYRSAESAQLETLKFKAVAGIGYEEIHTVTTGKTFYVTGVVATNRTAGTNQLNIATGESASEVDIMMMDLQANTSELLNLTIPMKFSSGTRISIKWEDAGNAVTLIGWEE